MSLIDKYQSALGKKRIAEKSPNNVFLFKCLANIFPKSLLIHIVRDGGDVVCSLLTMNWLDGRTGLTVDYTLDMRKATEYWISVVRAGREARKDPIAGPNYRELRYEDLVEEPELTLRKLFKFIREPLDPIVISYYKFKRNLAGESSSYQVLHPLYKSSMKRCVFDLKPSDKEIIKEVTGNLLIEL